MVSVVFKQVTPRAHSERTPNGLPPLGDSTAPPRRPLYDPPRSGKAGKGDPISAAATAPRSTDLDACWLASATQRATRAGSSRRGLFENYL
jgi:hypothetical protein